MPDIRLVQLTTPDVVSLDWLQSQTGQIDETNELITAVLVALGTDAQAAATDVLPDPRSSDRRGWWGDLQASQIWNGWPIGSLLWLLTRAKIVDQNAREGATIARVQAYISAAIQPFVDNAICSGFAVKAWVSNDGRNDRIMARLTLYRGSKNAIALEFQPTWSELFPNSANV
jgi:phage gp46-like protein